MEYIAQGKELGLSGSELREFTKKEFTKQRTKDKLESNKIAN